MEERDSRIMESEAMKPFDSLDIGEIDNNSIQGLHCEDVIDFPLKGLICLVNDDDDNNDDDLVHNGSPPEPDSDDEIPKWCKPQLV